MPTLELNDDQLIIKLNPLEKLAAFHGNIKVNGIAIRGAHVAPKRWWMSLGLRVPGTAFPGLVAGTYLKKGDRAFVSWAGRKKVLEITLADKMSTEARGTAYNRIIIGIDDAHDWANRINDAITAC